MDVFWAAMESSLHSAAPPSFPSPVPVEETMVSTLSRHYCLPQPTSKCGKGNIQN